MNREEKGDKRGKDKPAVLKIWIVPVHSENKEIREICNTRSSLSNLQ